MNSNCVEEQISDSSAELSINALQLMMAIDDVNTLRIAFSLWPALINQRPGLDAEVYLDAIKQTMIEHGFLT